MESPTSLELSSAYSRRAHDELVADGALGEGACEYPADLSLLAEAVFKAKGSQADLVNRLPKNDFEHARPNDGYLDAIALMMEGAVDCIVTLNYDLALKNAVVALGVKDVNVINGPKDMGKFGSKEIVYLHGNAGATDVEEWILRAIVLEAGWKDTWRELVVNRVSPSPLLVFAGLGSPAAVLTDSVSRLRRIEGGPEVYLVDPSPSPDFQTALKITEDRILRLKWSEFMGLLAERVALACCKAIEESATTISEQHGWEMDAGRFGDLIDCFRSAGLRSMGRARAVWLCYHNVLYHPDSQENREPMALLLLAFGKMLAGPRYELSVNREGLIEIRADDRIEGYVMALHGAGVKRSSIAPELIQKLTRTMTVKPDIVLIAGFAGPPADTLAPPGDIVHGYGDGDIVTGQPHPRTVGIEEVRGSGKSFSELMAS